jgi:Flavinator of succinate dehydrogenase
MAYLICRVPRIISRSIPIVSSTCLRNNTPSVPLISRLLSTTPGEPPLDDSLLPLPLDRSYETPEATRARLLYQSRKRGILETDLLLSTFANKHLSSMSETEMREYDKVIYH